MISIREHTYRGKDGFLICGKNARGTKVSIFTVTRSSAERIKEKVKRFENITVKDFEP